ncbi:heparin/heparin-sulfate lyase HepB [Parasediminibacterium sp. JCM 36343]|uniref:heparin/heparin-sulfate lyase HepB n=1 Tax=Parasediminibacterium sp. JCM 36343 TaxID=3374279 RepID=UPI003979CA13
MCYCTIANGQGVTTAATDTNAIVAIAYPPLTEREGKNLVLPSPPSEHPRLCFTLKNIALLKEKTTSPLINDCWEKLLKASKFVTDGYLPLGNIQNNDIKVRDAIEAKALLYALYHNEEQGKAAASGALHYLATLQFDKKTPDLTREMGRAILTGSLVYDWCYSLLSSAEKTTLIGRMETLATQMEIEWPQIKGSSITSHTVEAQLARDMLSFGIATYNEKPIIYNRIAGRMMAEFVPARNFFYPANYHHQGSAYGAYRFYWDMFTTFIFDRMGYPNFYGKQQQGIPYYFIYSRRPDGQLMRNGDDYTEQFTPFGKWWGLGQSALLYSGAYHKNAIVLNEAFKERKLGETPDYLFDFLFFDAKAIDTKATKASLPLTKYFAMPLGAMITRTGWEDGIASNDVVATMKVQEYNFSNHQHLDAGSFQLYYKGPLAVQSGIYQGKKGGYASEHFKNYSQRTIAHNTMLVYDSSEHFTWHGKAITNDGGQPYPGDAHEPENMNELLTLGYKTGAVLAHSFGPDSLQPDYTYLKGELAEAYPKKIKSFQRSFVFLNLHNKDIPAALIVFDRVEATNKNFKKTWLLHCVEEPSIKQNILKTKSGNKGYNGQLVNTTLLPLPNNLSIAKIGGLGNEFTVNSENYPQQIEATNNSWDSAVWRIEISPKIPAETDYFLNVMQVMDYDRSNKQMPAKAIETSKLTGTILGDRMVLFSKDGQVVNENLELTITGNTPLKVLVADVQNGKWKVQCTNNISQQPILIESTNHLLYFNVGNGQYQIIKL